MELVEGFEGSEGFAGVAEVGGFEGLGSKLIEVCQSEFEWLRVHFDSISSTKRYAPL
jgi:hypothetical protein